MAANATAQGLSVLQSYGALAVLAIILVVGIWRIVARLIGARRRAAMARTFRERFQAYAHSSGEDNEAYERLAFFAERMGNAMGRHGRVNATPPFSGRSAKKYLTVLQFIPELRMHFADLRGGGYGLGNEGASWIYHTVDDALIRFLGGLDETAKRAAKSLLNPIAWFREGAERLLALPFFIAGAFGLIEPGRAAAIEGRTSFRAVAGVAALIVAATIASTLIVGKARTAAAYRSIGGTAAEAAGSAASAVYSAFADVATAIATPKEEPPPKVRLPK